MALLVSAAVSAAPVLGATDTEVGTAGANGADGQIINNGGLVEVTDGQPGGGGGLAGAVANSSDAANTATAIGGNGGKGGNGRSAGALSSDGAAGGNGGSAAANASQASPSSDKVVTDQATATGGNGGDGGNGGSVRFGPTAPGGNGGKGGIAIATASGNSNTLSDLSYLQAIASAIGGNGGNGGTSGGHGGDGGVASIGNASAQASGKAVPQVAGIVIGGNGGSGGGGGVGGNGASESLNNALNISWSGHLTGTSGSDMLQEAVGGNGGGATSGTVGQAGSASSILNETFSNAPILDATTYAFGGDGGDAQFCNAGAGAGSTASTTIHSDYPIFVTAYANYGSLLISPAVIPAQAGRGGDVTAGTGNAGAGGSATATAAGYSTGSATNLQARSQANAIGGDGGSVLNTASGFGGAGGSATSTAIASNTTSDFLTVNSQSSGGNGGQGRGAGYAGGAGGSATIGSLQGTSPGGDITIGAAAVAGNGGSGVNGAAAGNGGDATLINPISASTSTIGKLSINVGAYGGDAGGSDGGAPGVGGDATSSLIRSFSVAPSDLEINVGAFAGSAAPSQNANGSAGGTANASIDVSTPGSATAKVTANTPDAGGTIYGDGADVTAGSGNGGAGADAIASGALHSTGAGAINLTLYSAGAKGGQGSGSGFAGGNGGAAMLNPSAVNSTGAAATLNSLAIGGDGGIGVNGAAGGNGAPVSLNNVVSGNGGTSLSLNQSARGGAGGSSDGAAPGAGGVATSQMNLNANGQHNVGAGVAATGGKGGDARNINAAPGADAHATMILSGDDIVIGSASSGSGGGGNVTAGLGGFSAGDAGNAYADSTVTGSGTTPGQSAVSAAADASGFFAGSVTSGLAGSGGRGGDARANATASGVGPDLVQASASAFGGAGGQGSGNGFASGSGGNAIAIANATNSAGPAAANVNASGGFSQPPLSGASAGAIGNVNVSSTAIGLNQATASTNVNQAIFGPSTSLAKANSTGLFSYLQSTASAPADQTGNAYSSASVNQPAPAFPINFAHATAALAGAPAASDVTSRWTPDANVKNAFANDPSNVQAITISDLNYPTGGSGASHLYSSAMELNINNAQVSSKGMLIGMLAAQLDGGGQGLGSGDTLRFRVIRNGSTLIDQTFASNPQLLSYFQNTVLALGPQNAGLNGANLDLKFLFDLTGSHPDAGIGTEFLLGTQAGAQAGVWNNSTGGSWAIPTNWSANTMPIGPGVSATFGNVITSAQTVALDENTTVGSIQFDNPSSAYTIAPGAGAFSLNLDNGLSQSVMTVISGHHTISAPINITAPGVRITVPGAQGLALSGGISGPGGITKFGDGSVLIGSMAVNGLDLQAGRIQFTPGSSAPARAVGALSALPGAILDIADGKLITASPAGTWNGSNYTNVAGLVQTGRNTGAGILSTAVTPGDKLHAIAVAKAGDIKSISDSATSTFAGQTVHGSDTLVMFTYGGDANLDGKINIDDYGLIDSHVGQSGTVFGWHNGDFNYDGKINIDDYGIIDGNIGAQSAPIPTIATAPELTGLAQLDGVTSVPEPASLALLGFIAVAPVLRRRLRVNLRK